jgi:uncharacterized membrane protein
MTERPSPDIDVTLRRFREYVAAAIALVIMLGTVVVVALALGYTNNPDQFARAKDLLQIVVPLLTFVLGYYFNKTSTEARAESAEATAKSATANAQQAAEARNLAETEAKAAKSEARETKSALVEVGQAAQKMMAKVPAPAPGTLGVDETTGEPVEDPRLEFRAAWARAERLIR